jgi:hypothetical protein
MQKDLYSKNNYRTIVLQDDDLKFDGKNLIVPSYWVGSIIDFINNVNIDSINEADREDFKLFKSFLLDIEDFNNQGN